MTEPFKCDGCGLCCKLLKTVPSMSPYHNGDGVCKFLTSDNKCSIYATRPFMCSVENMFNLRSSGQTWEEYCAMNERACEIIKEMFKEAEENHET